MKPADNFDLRQFITEGKLLKEELYFDWSNEDAIIMNDDTKDAILDDAELQEFITPNSFIRNKNGEVVLWIDWMSYEQFDKLANLLGIKY
jgi:hypothetical protein